jgi:hypothetical protein
MYFKIFTCDCSVGLSILYIIDELKIRSLNIKLGQLCKQVKDNICNSFLDFWNGERVDAIGSNRGKLDI